jgi:hypothetical protein
MLTLKNKNLGKVTPTAGLGKGLVYWLGKVRLGKFRLVLLAIESNKILNLKKISQELLKYTSALKFYDFFTHE